MRLIDDDRAGLAVADLAQEVDVDVVGCGRVDRCGDGFQNRGVICNLSGDEDDRTVARTFADRVDFIGASGLLAEVIFGQAGLEDAGADQGAGLDLGRGEGVVFEGVFEVARAGGVIVDAAAVEGEGGCGNEAGAKADRAQEAVLDAPEGDVVGGGLGDVVVFEAGGPDVEVGAVAFGAGDGGVDRPAEAGRARRAAQERAQGRAVPPVGRSDDGGAVGRRGHGHGANGSCG